jgi:acetyl esterase/lipase
MRSKFLLAAPLILIGSLCDCVPARPHRFRCPEQDCAMAKGLTLIIHGGGWQDDGTEPSDALTVAAERRWLSRGFATLAFSYRPSTEGPLNESLKALIRLLTPPEQSPSYPVPVPGSARHSVEDARAFYRYRREIVGEALAAKPTCVVGFSAGGHLALQVAASYPEIRCVVSDGGPTNLADSPLAPSDPDPRELSWIAGAYGQLAFGAPGATNSEGLRKPELSPAKLAASNAYSPNVRILLGNAVNDSFVGPGHAREFANSRPAGTRLFELTPASGEGAVTFVHSTVTSESLAAYRHAEDELARLALLP